MSKRKSGVGRIVGLRRLVEKRYLTWRQLVEVAHLGAVYKLPCWSLPSDLAKRRLYPVAFAVREFDHAANLEYVHCFIMGNDRDNCFELDMPWHFYLTLPLVDMVEAVKAA